ncbi:hypothetical protein AVEN_163389-1 [Araneus ventricosus]|uniref:Uncharacterized protein n=1 Tax=Araneus ventricosus TaxID=182803 RepID=A0A4Y2UME0_ARAVE|nr:hypothetical protein AVEN_163389-1 [Araneus ventricosus]
MSKIELKEFILAGKSYNEDDAREYLEIIVANREKLEKEAKIRGEREFRLPKQERELKAQSEEEEKERDLKLQLEKEKAEREFQLDKEKLTLGKNTTGGRNS